MALAGLVMLIGSRARDFIERHERAIFIAGIVLFVVLGAWIFWRS
jgi:hypothetical protein